MYKTLPPQKLFPYKLHRLLEAIDSNKGDPTSSSASIAWLSHGRAFKIHDQAKFICNVVPKYFKQTKLRSFIRQLHLWGFTRIIDGPDKGSWYHPNFLRGEPSKLLHIVRTPLKKKKSVDAPYLYVTPNYYDVPVIGVDGMPGMRSAGSAIAATIRGTPTMQSKSSGDVEAPPVFSSEEGLKEERIIDKSNLTGAVLYQLPASCGPSLIVVPYAMTRNSNQPPALTLPFATTSTAGVKRRSYCADTISEVLSHAPTSSLLQQHLDEYMMIQDLQTNHFIADPQQLSTQYNICSLQGEAIATTSVDRQPTDELVRRAIQFKSMGKNERRASCPELMIGDSTTAAKPRVGVLSNHGNGDQDFDAHQHQQVVQLPSSIFSAPSGDVGAPSVFSSEEGLVDGRIIYTSNLNGAVLHQLPTAYAPSLASQPYAMAWKGNRPPALTLPFAVTPDAGVQRRSSWAGTVSDVMYHAPTSSVSGPIMEDAISMQAETNASNAFTESGGQVACNHHSFKSNESLFGFNSFYQTADDEAEDEFVQFINEVLPNLID